MAQAGRFRYYPRTAAMNETAALGSFDVPADHVASEYCNPFHHVVGPRRYSLPLPGNHHLRRYFGVNSTVIDARNGNISCTTLESQDNTYRTLFK